MTELERTKNMREDTQTDSTDILFGDARGQMLGVMLTRDQNGQNKILKGFSGQFNGQYLLEGWVPPIFKVEQFDKLNTPEEKKIKALSHKLTLAKDRDQQQKLKKERRNRSRALMKKIHGLYILHNSKGEQRAMSNFFPQNKGIPTGAGDCCGPKLLQYAIKNNLTPLAMAEFYFGRQNKSNTKQHGHFYSSCTSGCAPILGFMLCGL